MHAGFDVVIYDHRGHGRSGREDGLPGYTRRFHRLADDLLAMLQLAQEQSPGKKCFAFAESFGGALPQR